MTAMTITELLAYWSSGQDKPHESALVDWDRHEAGDGLGCMSVCGQVLHVVGGWSPWRLREAKRFEVWPEVARLLNISVGHAALLQIASDRVDCAPIAVLTDPAQVLGARWGTLLDFYWHIDRMVWSQWVSVARYARERIIMPAAIADGSRADEPVSAVSDAAFVAALRYPLSSSHALAARNAAVEIQREATHGQASPYLMAFGFTSAAGVPSRPTQYGVTT